MLIQSRYFKPQELVSSKVYSVWGDNSYMFFSPQILQDLDLIREKWGKPIIINDWLWNGRYEQSGLRSNIDSIVIGKKNLYLSGHVMGKAFDLKDSQGRTKDLYYFIKDMLLNNKFKSFKRLESTERTPTWLHIDALQPIHGINIFK
jgi:hypothetical protein